MSIEIARQAFSLGGPSRPAHTEFSLHYDLMAEVTGLSADADRTSLTRSFYDAWDVDFLWHTHDGPVGWHERGRTTDMGHAVFMADGSDRREPKTCPFRNVEEVLAFDAVTEYGLDDLDELTRYYQGRCDALRADYPQQLIPGGYYHTMVTGATRAFGWDLLLEAAAQRDGFEQVLDSFHRLAIHHARAWAATDIEVFICHDDMVWTSGPFMHPDIYRQAIIPRYRELWSILHAADKKVLFCCDGDWSLFVDDIAEAGADGFIFEPVVSFEMMAQRFGRSHVLVGSAVDCRTLTFGDEAAVRAEVRRSLDIGLDCPGWIAVVGNHIASNVPVANALAYYDELAGGWGRRS